MVDKRKEDIKNIYADGREKCIKCLFNKTFNTLYSLKKAGYDPNIVSSVSICEANIVRQLGKCEWFCERKEDMRKDFVIIEEKNKEEKESFSCARDKDIVIIEGKKGRSVKNDEKGIRR